MDYKRDKKTGRFLRKDLHVYCRYDCPGFLSGRTMHRVFSYPDESIHSFRENLSFDEPLPGTNLRLAGDVALGFTERDQEISTATLLNAALGIYAVLEGAENAVHLGSVTM